MSNPFSTGQGGAFFESSVQTAFVINMIVNGRIPYLPEGRVEWIKLQGRDDGFQTDDFILCLNNQNIEYKFLAQIKRDITINSKTEEFNKVIKEFWADFNNPNVFNQENDIIVLIKGGLLQTDKSLKTVLDWAKTTSDEHDFLKKLDKGKTNIYNQFKTALKLASETTLSEKQIWCFLKKIFILSFDFDFAEQSQYKFDIESLIRITKNINIDKTENEIWNSVHNFVEKRNFTGSRITKETLEENKLLYYFDLNNLVDTRKAINKLKSNTDLSFKSISDKIGGIKHFEREALGEQLKEQLFQSHFTIITGEPGVGKTAFVKNILDSLGNQETNILAFKAEQLIKSQLAETFASIGINDNLNEIFTDFSLLPYKIVFIDDIHKLSGVQLDYAFRELLDIICDKKNIYFIATCRTYAFEKILQKYSNWLSGVIPFEVPRLSSEELIQISETFPDFKALIYNEKLSLLLSIPQYLDYAVRSKAINNQKALTIPEFKNIIWDNVVKGQEKCEIHIQKRRSRLFERISEERARNRSLFIEVSDADLEIAESLKAENVLYEYNEKYAPSHDTLEDIALERFINKKYLENKYNPSHFLNQIGNEPAIYRAFYLWCLMMLEANNDEFEKFATDFFSNSDVAQFWIDELIHAILETDYSIQFFEKNQTLLLKNQAALFNRFYKVLNAACLKYDSSYERNATFNPYAFLPSGDGWSVLALFVVDNYNDLQLSRNQIVNLFQNWFLTVTILEQHESLAKKIGKYALSLLQEPFEPYGQDNLIKSILVLMLNLSPLFKLEIKLIFNETIEFEKIRKRKKNLQYDSDIYRKFSEIILFNGGNLSSCSYFPELVCKLIKISWLDTNEKNVSFDDFDLPNDDRIRNLGLRDYIFSQSPPSANKTPIGYLLSSNYLIALKFIVELIDYSTDVFFNSNFNKTDSRFEIYIELENGKKSIQKAALTLWCMYRGTYSNTPDILQSVLMALEKWLLNLAKNDDKEKLMYSFDYLMENCKSVATTSLLLSVATAYPLAFADRILSLLKIKEFYVLDKKRKANEYKALAPYDSHNHDNQFEQYKSNKLPHRNQTIEDLVRNLTFTVYKNEIFKLIDQLKVNSNNSDLSWSNTLYEIDFRNWGITKRVEDGFEMAPTNIPDEIIEWQREGQLAFKNLETKLNLKIWTGDVFENETIEENHFNQWEILYKNKEQLISNSSDKVEFFLSEKELIKNQLVILAAIGIRDYYEIITEAQKIWCYQLVYNSIIEAIEYRFQEFSYKSASASMILPFILKRSESQDKEEIKKIIISTLTIADEETIKHASKGIKRYLWGIDSTFAEMCVKAILEYNKINESLSFHHRMLHSNDRDNHFEIILEKQAEFVENYSEKISEFNLNKIAFSEQSKTGIIHALKSVPFNVKNEFVIQLYYSIIDHIFSPKPSSNKNERINYQFDVDFQQLLANFLLGQEKLTSELVLRKLLSGIEIAESEYKKSGNSIDLVKYLQNIHETISKTMFYMQYNVSSSFGEHTFWYLWEVIAKEFKRINITGGEKIKNLFLDLMFQSENWLSIDDKKDFFKQIILDFGHSKDGLEASMKLLTGIGAKFSPESLNWIWIHLSNDENNLLLKHSNTLHYFGVYMQNIIKNHLANVRSNENYRKICFSILDKMFDSGSNIAYKLREQMIIN